MSGGIDPKGAAGAKKPPLATVPSAVLLELACAHGEGDIKYDFHNWRESGGVVISTYVAAAQRHLLAFMMGEDYDPDSGSRLSHLIKAMASLSVLRDAMIHGVATDDRPPPSPPETIARITSDWLAVREAAEAVRDQSAPPPAAPSGPSPSPLQPFRPHPNKRLTRF